MTENKKGSTASDASRRTDPDVLIHPVRLRVLAEFGGRTRTTQELARALPDVPVATLYRHVGVLHDAGVLQVVEEQAVRGAVERTFQVASGADRLQPEDLAGATRDEMLAHVQTFLASLADTAATAMSDTDAVDLLAAGFSASRIVVHLSDDERDHFGRRLDALVTDMAAREPGPGRRPYTLGSIVVPGRQRSEP